MSAVKWVSWDRAKLAHACPASSDRVGSFPLYCGKWAPDAFDAGYMSFHSTKPHCSRCQKRVNREEAARLAAS